MGNELIGKVGELLHEADQDTFDAAVATAKRRMSEEDSKARRNGFDNLFDSQIQTLRDRGCPQVIVDMLTYQKSTVLLGACDMTFEEGHVPFLPIIPTTYLTIYSQMPMVRNDGKEGSTYLELVDKISNVVDTPVRPYYIFDVEDGEAMRGKSPEDAEKAIKEQGRYSLIEVEVIALGVHTDMLSRRYVCAAGSRYDSGDVPYLLLCGGRPNLGWGSRDDARSYWGAASCGSR